MEMISKAPVGQSVATLQDLADSNKGGAIHFPLPPGMVASLNRLMSFQTPRIVIQFGRGSVIGILDAVRNMTLDWAIEMEKKGVLGDGMSFDPQEKMQAKEAMTTFNIGSIGSFVGNMGSGNTSGDIVVSIESLQQIKDIIEQIKSSHDDLVRSGVDGGELSANIADIEDAINAPQPKKVRLRGLLDATRQILIGAAGNLTAAGAITLISAVVSSLG